MKYKVNQDFEVKINDKITLNGIKNVTVTQELVDSNPNIFKDTKDLKYYEDLLLRQHYPNLYVKGGGLVSHNEFHYLLKENEPHFFYIKVLRLIAKDLNGDWDGVGTCYILSKDGIPLEYDSRFTNCSLYTVLFKNRESAIKASKILGEKIMDMIYQVYV